MFTQRTIAANNTNNRSVSPINTKLSHSYAERSDSRSLASSPLSSSPCVGHCNASDTGNDIDMDDDNVSDTCSEKDSEIAKNDVNNGSRMKDSPNLQNNSSMNNRRKKKTRTVFTRSQVFQLESTFDMKRYLSSSERAGLAASLHLTETQVCWPALISEVSH